MLEKGSGWQGKKLREIIKAIQNLDEMEQYRLKEFFNQSLAFFSASEPVFKEISDQKHKKGYTCVHCQSTNAVRFGKYKVKVDLKLMERQRYRCKDCRFFLGTEICSLLNIYVFHHFGIALSFSERPAEEITYTKRIGADPALYPKRLEDKNSHSLSQFYGILR